VAPSATASAQITGWAKDGKERFELSQIQDLRPWTALHVFAPYTSVLSIQQQLGFEWRDAGSFDLDMRDDIYLAVFVSEKQVVRVEEWRRGAFDCLPILTGRALSPSSVIYIDRTNPVPRLTVAEP
jgi:hypothetical protein